MQVIKYKHEKPEIWDALVNMFNVDWENTAVAYGDTVYSKYEIPAETKAHEVIHLRQQNYNKTDAVEWWVKYLKYPKFRYTQELEAFRAEYQYLTNIIKDRNNLNKALRILAGRLSGKMYGKIVTLNEAMQKIKK